jgi:hypothetical protein
LDQKLLSLVLSGFPDFRDEIQIVGYIGLEREDGIVEIDVIGATCSPDEGLIKPRG